jgi:hypothetical protein
MNELTRFSLLYLLFSKTTVKKTDLTESVGKEDFVECRRSEELF